MSQASQTVAESNGDAEPARLEVDIYQLVDDSILHANRTDGTGWDWCWADYQREWMDSTPHRFAYRCLPLTIANQMGWWIKNPVGFTATWDGRGDPGSIEFRFDVAEDVWGPFINSQFGQGIITWNTPFLFRTKPKGSRLLVTGPANYFKENAHPLTAVIESDWMRMSFTMNWKLMEEGRPTRFEFGDPLFQAIPISVNLGASLEKAVVTYQKLDDDPEVARAYREWSESRRQFHEQKVLGDVQPDGWQKDYFHGRDIQGRKAASDHMTKVKAPAIIGLPDAKKQGPLTTSTRPVLEPTSSQTKQAPPPQLPDNANAQGDHGETNVVTISQANLRRDAAATPEAEAPPRVDDEWRRWIAENLLLGKSAESIQAAMKSRGISEHEASYEVGLAAQSPYLKGADRLRNRLKKREWLLSSYRKINRLHPDSREVVRRHKLSREEFLRDYYSTNRPVIITGMMEDWPARQRWNLDYFAGQYGDREVEVQFGRTQGENYEIEREKYLRTMRFDEFIGLVRDSGVSNDFYLTANNNSKNKKAFPELWNDIVQIPEYLNGQDPMGGFLWIGPAGTITPFHHDLTNNFMAQVIGHKRVKIAPSWDLPLMQNHFHVFSDIDGRKTPPTRDVSLDEPQILECVIGPGEILFLPIGCLHFVEGLDISVTVSFTTFIFDNSFSSFYSTYHEV